MLCPFTSPAAVSMGLEATVVHGYPRLQALRGGDVVSRSDQCGWPAVANFSQSASVRPGTRSGVRDWATYTREGKRGTERFSQLKENQARVCTALPCFSAQRIPWPSPKPYNLCSPHQLHWTALPGLCYLQRGQRKPVSVRFTLSLFLLDTSTALVPSFLLLPWIFRRPETPPSSADLQDIVGIRALGLPTKAESRQSVSQRDCIPCAVRVHAAALAGGLPCLGLCCCDETP